jgi:hypothetical protein
MARLNAVGLLIHYDDMTSKPFRIQAIYPMP